MHIQYLTGLSIDKIKWDQIYSEAFNDNDYLVSKNVALTFLSSCGSKTTLQQALHNFWVGRKEAAVTAVVIATVSPSAAINIVVFESIISLGFAFQDYVSESLSESQKKLISEKNSDLKLLIETKDIFQTINRIVSEFNVSAREGGIVNENFFGLYQSNQGDLRALAPATAIGANNNTHSMGWAYCDEPYYRNIFVDSVGLKITNNYLDKLSENESANVLRSRLVNCYDRHATEVIVARALGKLVTDKSFEDNVTVQDILLKLKQSSSKNLFGIAILSNILFELDEQVTPELKIHISSCEIDPKLALNENSKKSYLNDTQNALLELLAMAGLRENANFKLVYSENDADLLICCHRDDFQKKSDRLNRLQTPENSRGPGVGEEKSFEDYVISGNDRNDEIKEIYCSVPAKMLLSIPLKNDFTSDRSLLIPEICRAQDSSSIYLTVGGTEHNRALTHLLTQWVPGTKNSFVGFLDNNFHRKKMIENKATSSMLVGTNQPVSGIINHYFFERLADAENSVNTDGVAILFKIKEPMLDDRTDCISHYVYALYGFSAFASRLLQEKLLVSMADYEKCSKAKSTSEYLASIAILEETDLDILENDGVVIHRYSINPKLDKIYKIETKIFANTNDIDSFHYMLRSSSSEVSALQSVYKEIFPKEG